MKDSAKRESAAIREDLVEVKGELVSLNKKVETVSNSVIMLRNETNNFKREVDSQLVSLNSRVTNVLSSVLSIRQESSDLKMSLETVNNSLLKAQEDIIVVLEIISSQIQSPSIKMPRKVGIFWDQQNVRIPKRCLRYPGRLLNFIRNYFAEPGFEVTEYCAVMDFDKENKKLKNILSEFLTAVHVNGKAKNSEDKKIVKLMRQYRDNVGPDCTVVLISGDTGFIKVIEELKRQKVHVVLVHNDNCGLDLKKKVNRAIHLESLLEDLDDITMTDEEMEAYNESSDFESEDVDLQIPMITEANDGIMEKRPREETQGLWQSQDDLTAKKFRVASPVRMNTGPSQSSSFSKPSEKVQVMSKRAKILINYEDFFYKYLLMCDTDEYDEEKNSTGYINMGTAANADIIHPKITHDKIWGCDTSLIQYKEDKGTKRLREAIASMLTELLRSCEPIDPDNLYCTVGVTNVTDVLTHYIADPGDVIMIPTPVYGYAHANMLQKALVKMWPIPVISENNEEDQPRLTLDKVKDSYLKAVQSNENVRGIMLLNPNNPLGELYAPELVKSILEFCYDHQLHAIIDEAYALSILDEESNFQSVLTFEHVPDPERTHVLYGLSKDFTLTGLRIGVIHSKCKELRNCLIQSSFFQNLPFPVMGIADKFLEDIEMCKIFVQKNQSRLREQFNFCKERLMAMNLPVWDSEAGFFLWVNFRLRCNISTFEDENEFFIYLIKSFHLYIVPGKELLCAQPGWFRISFPGSPHHVAAGFDRLELALEQNKSQLKVR